MGLHKTYQFESFGITHIGLVREHNEDVWIANPEQGLFILADGMGGHLAGEIAAKEAVDSLNALTSQWMLYAEPSNEEEVKDFFKYAFSEVNALIYKKGVDNEELKGMGTTLSSLFFFEKQAILTHVGDSRIYRLRHNKLEQLTEDHSLLFELLALNAIKVEDAETFPYKHILTRAIGTHRTIEPTVGSIHVEQHDLFLLSSDGLTNYVDQEQMEEILNQKISLAQKGRFLVDLALDQGGGDNITLILVDAFL